LHAGFAEAGLEEEEAVEAEVHTRVVKEVFNRCNKTGLTK
jgi:hypothetical protein